MPQPLVLQKKFLGAFFVVSQELVPKFIDHQLLSVISASFFPTSLSQAPYFVTAASCEYVPSKFLTSKSLTLGICVGHGVGNGEIK